MLLNAATAYMNLLRDSAILDLQRRNVEVLQEQLRQTRDRFNVGEVTRTDVAQAESQLAAGRSQVLTRRSQLHRLGGDLSAGDRHRSGQAHAGHAGRPLLAAQPAGRGRRRHAPAIRRSTTAQYNVDVAQLQVKVAEGALYPTVSVQGSFQQELAELVSSLNTMKSYNASVFGHAERADLSGRRGIFR